MAKKAAARLSSEKVENHIYWKLAYILRILLCSKKPWTCRYLNKLKLYVAMTYFYNKNESATEYLGNINKKTPVMILHILDYSYSRNKHKCYILKSLPF